jgi:hypothetical protein
VDKISILASPYRANLLLKAAQKVAQQETLGTESVSDFEKQNPASKRLVDEVSSVFDQAYKNLIKEIKEVLVADRK